MNKNQGVKKILSAALIVLGFAIWVFVIRMALSQQNENLPAVNRSASSQPDLHLVQELTEANYETDVLPQARYTPTLIWMVRPERASVFKSDALTMERAAETWQGFVRFLRVDVTRVTRDSRLDQDLLISTSSMTFMLMQVVEQDMHHHDLYKIRNYHELASMDIQDQLLNFKPDCPRKQCPLCNGSNILGRRPVAWR